jgi:hypothetical protein
MKKVLFTLMILISACALKAQQLTLTPLDSALIKSPKNLQPLKFNDTSLFKNYLNTQKPEQLALLNTLKQDRNADIVYSTMPVARIGNSDDRMPVVKPGEANMKYMMPVKKVKMVNPLEDKSVLRP